jgi:hypothetical protein
MQTPKQKKNLMKNLKHLRHSLRFAICYFRAKLIVRRVKRMLDPLGLQPVCTKSDTFENALLLLIFNNSNIANLGDATGVRGSTAPGSLYVSLHTADPTDTGTQTSNEAAYGGYGRIGVARDNTHWTVTGNSVSPAANIDFAECTGTPGGAITHFGIGLAASGAGNLLYSGAVSPTITMAVGVIPRLKTTSTITED